MINQDIQDIREAIAEPGAQRVTAARDAALHRLLKHSTATVPFYQAGGWREFEDFPVVDKKMILGQYEDFCSQTYAIDQLPTVHTSGSSGTPFHAPRDPRKRKRHIADLIVFGEQSGFSFGDPLFFFKVSRDQRTSAGMQRLLQNVRYVNADDDDPQWADGVDRQLRGSRHPLTITGYAAIIEQALRRLKSGGVNLGSYQVNTVIASAERASQWLQDTCAEDLGVSLRSRYANEENGILAQQTTWSSSDFVVNTASFIIELLALDNDRPVPPGETGRVVVTDLFATAMPFIRYDTGDLARSTSDGQPRLAEVMGRQRDMLFDSKGDPVLPAVVSHNMTHFAGIQQYQFAQLGPRQYQLRMEANDDPRRDELIDTMARRVFGEHIEFSVEYVNDVGTMASGKRRPIANFWEDRPGND